MLPGHENVGRRAVWTTHIASVVKQCADLMGLFTCFESGGRTDAVIQTASEQLWAKIEWEWLQPFREKVNELDKLASAAAEAKLLVFIGYSQDTRHSENMSKIVRSWKGVDTPLVVFLITYHYEGGRRHFQDLQTHYLRSGGHKKIREQKALPWDVEGTKWRAAYTSASPTHPAM